MEKRELNNKIYDFSSNMNDIALLGGSFNPVHNGHLAMAELTHKLYGLDVVFIPNKTTYYKASSVFAPDPVRMEMLYLSIRDKDYAYLSDIEIVRGGITHTIDTIREIRNYNNKRKIYFIIGGDSLEWLDKWVEGDVLLKEVIFLVAVRDKTDKTRCNALIKEYSENYPGSQIELLPMDNISISSSDIREKVAANHTIKGMVPDSVEDYIKVNKLYIN